MSRSRSRSRAIQRRRREIAESVASTELVGAFQLDISKAARQIQAQLKGHGKFLPPPKKPNSESAAEG